MPKILLLIICILFAGVIVPFIYGAHWAFYYYQFIYFLNPEARWWSFYIPSLPYSKISVIILIITFWFNKKNYDKNLLTKIPPFKWMVLLLIVYFALNFIAINPAEHQKALINYFKMFVILGFAYKVLDSQQKLEWALLAYLVGATYLSYETYVTGRNSGDRVEGVGVIDAPEANGTAATLVPAIPLIIFYFWLGSKKLKFAMLIAGAFIVNATILINSRGAFLGVASGALYFLWGMFASRVKKKLQKLTVVFFIIMGITAILIVVDASFYERMLTITDVEDENKSGSHRYRMWLATFDVLRDHPLGVGAYGYETLSPIYVDPSLFFGGQTMKAVHSIWFQALAEVGWIGFFFFMMMIISTYRLTKVIKEECKSNGDLYRYYLNHALLSSYIGVLIASSFINQFRVQIVYWFVLFIACYYSIVIVNKDKRQSGLVSSAAKNNIR